MTRPLPAQSWASTGRSRLDNLFSCQIFIRDFAMLRNITELFPTVISQILLKSGVGQSTLGIAVQIHGVEKGTEEIASWTEAEFEQCLK